MDSDKETLMLKAELEDGYGRVANLLLEALSMSQLNGKQMSICLFIIRKTYSWGKKSNEIKLKDFALACDSSETYMSKQIKQLIAWKVIKRNNYSPGKIPEYEINTRVEEWDKGCLNVQGLRENIANSLYKGFTLEQKDKGCLNRQGLNKETRQPLNKRTRVVMGSAIEDTGLDVPLKESSKEITTTVSIEPETNETENLVADMDADSIQQENLGDSDIREKDLQAIEGYYKRDIRGKVVCSGKDFIDITHAYEKYKDVDFIISVLKKAKEDYISRYGKLEINSFSYFESILEERWKALHTQKDVQANKGASTPKKNNYSNNKNRARKTRFHNFEQRSDGYTAEQLEDIAARKRAEAKARIKSEGAIYGPDKHI